MLLDLCGHREGNSTPTGAYLLSNSAGMRYQLAHRRNTLESKTLFTQRAFKKFVLACRTPIAGETLSPRTFEFLHNQSRERDLRRALEIAILDLRHRAAPWLVSVTVNCLLNWDTIAGNRCAGGRLSALCILVMKLF